MVLHLRNEDQEKLPANVEWCFVEMRIQGGRRMPTGHPCLATPRFRREDFLDASNVRVNLGCQEEVRRLPFVSAWKAVGISPTIFPAITIQTSGSAKPSRGSLGAVAPWGNRKRPQVSSIYLTRSLTDIQTVTRTKCLVCLHSTFSGISTGIPRNHLVTGPAT